MEARRKEQEAPPAAPEPGLFQTPAARPFLFFIGHSCLQTVTCLWLFILASRALI